MKRKTSLKKINLKTEQIAEAANESEPEEVPKKPVEQIVGPKDFKVCVMCTKALNEDEKIINSRFVNEALEAGKDISVFPICIKCNFE